MFNIPLHTQKDQSILTSVVNSPYQIEGHYIWHRYLMMGDVNFVFGENRFLYHSVGENDNIRLFFLAYVVNAASLNQLFLLL